MGTPAGAVQLHHEKIAVAVDGQAGQTVSFGIHQTIGVSLRKPGMATSQPDGRFQLPGQPGLIQTDALA